MIVKRAGKQILLLLVGLALGLTLTEGVLRATGWVKLEAPKAEPTPLFGWRHIPNSAWWFDVSGGRVPIRINSKGLRDREFDYEKPPRVFRILVLGDSMIEGSQVAAEKTFPKQLERQLNEGNPITTFEVINTGMGGYGTDNEVLFYQYEGAKYQPDLVLLAFSMANDVYDNSHRVLPVGTPGKPPKPYFVLTGEKLQLQNFPCRCSSNELPHGFGRLKVFLRRHSALYGLTSRTLSEQFPRVASTLADLGISRGLVRQRSWMEVDGIPLPFYNFSPDFPSAWEEAWQVTRSLLALAKELVEKDKGQLVVIGIPMREQVHPEVWNEALRVYPGLTGGKWDLDKPEKTLAAALASANIPYVSLLSKFRHHARSSSQLLFYDTPQEAHLNATGQALTARIVREALHEWGLIPTKTR